MRKTIKTALLVVLSILIFSSIYVFIYVPDLSKQYGVVEHRLYLGNSDKQPLVVAFGGGDGGNDWTRTYLKGKRDSLNKKGYALLAIGYFKSNGTPKHLDRISLNAIRDTILSVAKHSKIDHSKVILMGGSRGGELVLNLASRCPEFNGVIALSTSNVSFPAITWSANTSSWMYNDEEVPYVPAPLKTISPALKGDLFTAHSMMLEDEGAVKNAEIPVENIKGSILILSGKEDDQWPATKMSEQIMKRLKEHHFEHYYAHIQLDGGHVAPLEHFDLVFDFLEEHFKSVATKQVAN